MRVLLSIAGTALCACVGCFALQNDAIRDLQRTLADSPDPALVWFQIARVHVQNAEYGDAVAALRQAAAICPDVDPSGEDEFAPLRQVADFRALAAQAGRAAPPIVKSTVAFTIPEPDLFPEGLAYDNARGVFYAGSIHKHKILEIRMDGTRREFAGPAPVDLGEVLGMKVDPRTSTLWAASNGKGGSAVFRFDLRSGRLMKRYAVAGSHLLNDVVIDRFSNAFVTDTDGSTIFRISPEQDRVENFGASLGLKYPNGIAISDDGKTLFVADYSRGIAVVDIASRRLRTLARPKTFSLALIDGLYFDGGDLVAIQNGVVTPRVIRLSLAPGFDRVEKAEVLERRHPLYRLPTTGAIASGAFYYFANTHIRNLDGDRVLRPEELRPIQILKLPLP